LEAESLAARSTELVEDLEMDFSVELAAAFRAGMT
jgi:hypothetical protein